MKTKLGYAIDTGDQVDVETSHMMVTGVTALSGKTTTLEAMLKRNNLKAIVFRTKRGEKVFQDGNFIQPYFKDRSDWEFVESLIEAITKQKLKFFEHTMILRLCQESHDSLFDLKQVIDDRLEGKKKKLGRFESDVLLSLQAYLDKALPKLKNIPFTDKLELKAGLNIIDLEDFHDDDAVLSLIISSVVEEVLEREDTITVIPEAWKFIPENRKTPCKLSVERLIRQGATNSNWVWIDSQDIAGVAKSVIKQISIYLLGYQAEPNEVKHTIDTIPLPKSQKPKPEDIMNLGKGVFYLVKRDLKAKVYVQPIWLSDEEAKKIAIGELKVSNVKDTRPKKTLPKQNYPPMIHTKQEVTKSKPVLPIPEPEPKTETKPQKPVKETTEKLSDETLAYVDKMIGRVERKLGELEQVVNTKASHDDVVNQIMARMPKIEAGVTKYEIAPVEALKKTFLQDAKDKIISDISNLSKDAKKLLKYLEARGIGIALSEICVKCFFMKSGGGGYAQQVKAWASELIEIQMLKKQSNGKYLGALKDRIIELVKANDATDQEVEDVYNHVLMEVLGEKIE